MDQTFIQEIIDSSKDPSEYCLDYISEYLALPDPHLLDLNKIKSDLIQAWNRFTSEGVWEYQNDSISWRPQTFSDSKTESLHLIIEAAIQTGIEQGARIVAKDLEYLQRITIKKNRGLDY